MGRKTKTLEIPELDVIEAELRRVKYQDRYRAALKGTIYTLVVVAAVAILVATLWLPFLRIYGTSMAPTLQDGEIICCLKTSDYEAGDITAFYYNNKLLVKRVIGQPGDWVNMDENGNVYVNDILLEEPYNDVFSSILTAFEQLEDVSLETIMDSLEWGNRIQSSCADAFIKIQRLIKLKDQEYQKAEKEHNRDLVSQIASDRDDLVRLLQMPLHVIPDNYPRILMQHQIVIVKGEAGVGKSQLFAVAADKLLSENRGVILLLGTNYLNNQSIFTQTPNALITDLSLDALLYKLEAMAVLCHQGST